MSSPRPDRGTARRRRGAGGARFHIAAWRSSCPPEDFPVESLFRDLGWVEAAEEVGVVLLLVSFRLVPVDELVDLFLDVLGGGRLGGGLASPALAAPLALFLFH